MGPSYQMKRPLIKEKIAGLLWCPENVHKIVHNIMRYGFTFIYRNIEYELKCGTE